MSKTTVQEATENLIHALGNYLGIVLDSRGAKMGGFPRFIDDAAVGVYAMDKAPELRAALDALRVAMSVAKIEAEDTEESFTHHVWTNSHTGETLTQYEGGGVPMNKKNWIKEFAGNLGETELFCTGWRAGWLAREVCK